MLVDIIMPKMGESITEGTILEWHKKVGESIERDEIFLEIGTDKVDSEIPSPNSGILAEILAQPNQVVPVGEVIARIETESGAVVEKPQDFDAGEKKPVPESKRAAAAFPKSVKAGSEMNRGEKRFITPVVSKIAEEAGIPISDLNEIPGTGAGGRVTKQDILNYIKQEKPAPATSIKTSTAAPAEEKMEMGNLRRIIAERMRHSLDTAAHVYVMNEVDMSLILNFIQVKADEFYEKEEFKLTLTPFIIMAAVAAIKTFPQFNSELDGTSVIHHKHINMGMAVALEKGLMVPVIKNCEELNFLGLCRKVRDLAIRTRSKKITADELQGSTFSITNFGIFDVTMGTPIINQPNVGILGVGAVKKRPIVQESPQGDSIAIRSIMMLSLGFDHRLVDGADGSRFIQTIKQNLESMDLSSLF
ncbi:MAG: dihydrolipoamide acetyltransferase family protein [Candidatus Neomarinimicrobiota bacterium]